MTKIVQLPGAAQKPVKQTEKKQKNVRADGRRQVSYTDDAGKRHYFYGKTLTEAREKMLDDKRQRGMGLDPDAGKQLLQAWVDRWVDVYGSKAGYSTNRGVKLDAGKLKDALGAKQIGKITQIDVQGFANDQAHYSKSGVFKIRSTTNRIFEHAVINGIIFRNPCTGVKWSHSGEGTHRALTNHERMAIMENWQKHRCGLWTMIMLWSGLRIGEVLALRWSDVDFDAGVIHVWNSVRHESNDPVENGTTKNGESRDVTIFAPLKEILSTLPLPPQCEFVCPSEKGKLVKASEYQDYWEEWDGMMKEILKVDQIIKTGKMQTAYIRSHDLRHSFCTFLYESGVDIKTAQRLMGHKTIDMTMKIYTHLSPEKLSKSVEEADKKAQEFLLRCQKDVKPSENPYK